jgi:hypothetical protein
MFLEIEVDPRTGQEKGQQEVNKDEIMNRHPAAHDLWSWVAGARIGSVFSMLSKGYKYKKLS